MDRREIVRARERLYRAIRDWFRGQGFDEVETPCLVPAPGMEPHIRAFEVPFVPEMSASRATTLYLHTSPEYAMKRLLAEGFERIFQIVRVFRNGEVAQIHNPEFTMLEFYRTGCDYGQIMDDLQQVLPVVARAVGGTLPGIDRGFERVAFREAILARTGIDIARCEDAAALRTAAAARSLTLSSTATRDELLLQLLLDHVEPHLGRERPTFLVEYPASMASLARLKPGDPSVAERFELYAGGLELANGFSELNDSTEQRQRLIAEQEERRKAGHPVYPLDERFIEAVGRMPSCAGVALGLDRLLMILLGAKGLSDVLLFPAGDYLT